MKCELLCPGLNRATSSFNCGSQGGIDGWKLPSSNWVRVPESHPQGASLLPSKCIWVSKLSIGSLPCGEKRMPPRDSGHTWDLPDGAHAHAHATFLDNGLDSSETSVLFCDPNRALAEELDLLQHDSTSVEFLTYLNLLRRCGNAKALSHGMLVHDHICRSRYSNDRILGSVVVEMYGKCGAVEDARSVFNDIRRRNVYTWNIMISAYVQNNCCDDALVLFRQMIAEEIEPDNFTFSSVLGACSSIALLAEGHLIHASVVNAGLELDVVVGTALLNMYAKCGSLEKACKMFDRIPRHDVVAWNALVAACVHHQDDKYALEIFEKVVEQEDLKPNHSTYVSVLSACANLGADVKGTLIHISIILAGVEADVVIGTALVNMYGKCGSLDLAEGVFNRMHQRDVVTWNTLLAAYAQHRRSTDTLRIIQLMSLKGMKPDQYTFSTMVDACSDLTKGRIIHAFIVDTGFESQAVIGNALITMYSKCGSLDDALTVFDRMPERTVVSWNAMITAYEQHGHSKEAVLLYFQMQCEEIKPNDVTFISVLGACASMAALEEGKMIHKSLVDAGFESEAVVGTAVVHMYGKCGDLDNCRKVFDRILERNVVCWNVIFTAYAQHGMGKEVLELFSQMQQEGVWPDEITFISILHACSHAGLVNDAKAYFASMSKDYGISPSVEHYSSMIDLLGRFGHLEEAEAFLKDMPVEPDVVAWKAFLGACRTHGDMERGKRAAEHAIKLDPKISAPYVLLSNIYAADRRWDDVAEVRKALVYTGTVNQPG